MSEIYLIEAFFLLNDLFRTAPQSFDEKSILVAKLTKEVDARGDAIRRIGQDLTICREQNSVLEV